MACKGSAIISPENTSSTPSFSRSRSKRNSLLFINSVNLAPSRSSSTSSTASYGRTAPVLSPSPSSKLAFNMRKRLQRSTSEGPDVDRNAAETMLGKTIGKEFLTEVHKIQRLLKESQENSALLETDKTNGQQKIDFLSRQLRQKCIAEERLKEEIWDLELAKQELTQQIQELSQSLTRSRLDQARVKRQEGLISQELELLKASHESWSKSIEKTQHDYEHELASLRQTLEGVRQERDNLARELEQYKASIPAPPSTPIPRSVPSENNSTVSHTPDKETLSTTPNKRQNKKRTNSILEVETLRVSLAHSHSVVQALHHKLEKERLERSEIDALLRESQETIENFCKLPRTTRLESWTDSSADSTVEEPLNDTYTLSYYNDDNNMDSSIPPLLIRSRSLGDELFMADAMSRKPKCPDVSEVEAIYDPEEETYRGSAIIERVNFSDPKEAKSWTHCKLPAISHPPSQVVYPQPWFEGNHSVQEECGSVIVDPGTFMYGSDQISEQDTHPGPKARPRKYTPRPGVEEQESVPTQSIPTVARTMIGDWMLKYTRKRVGQGISEKKHRRFFWIHPYSMTLYWSTQEPGTRGGPSDAKSALVESFKVDTNPVEAQTKEPPSLTINTLTRNLKIQCLSHETHAVWIKSLYYLLNKTRKNIPSCTPSYLLPPTSKSSNDSDYNDKTRRETQRRIHTLSQCIEVEDIRKSIDYNSTRDTAESDYINKQLNKLAASDPIPRNRSNEKSLRCRLSRRFQDISLPKQFERTL
ncbi:meiotic cell cortex C-terminal pleckstrin homology-domain-containing protein [Phycomyces nitens]|nr:meiotic cell cortex C-terminal pleckstrin homology-domain-containing protein [Phycomyces nitens]